MVATLSQAGIRTRKISLSQVVELEVIKLQKGVQDRINGLRQARRNAQ
jgi:hypothetical protein